MKIKNFSDVAQNLQPYLIEFLEKKGIDTTRNFGCINPEHKDASPSMSIVRPENIRFYCHGCAASGDIFDAAHLLEDKPLAGPAFAIETVDYLAEMFGVTVERTEPTEEEIYELDTYRAYDYAHDFIINWTDDNLPKDVKAEFDKRKWTSGESLRQYGVGFITDSSKFREHMKGLGFAASFLDDIDLGRKDIFAPGHLIFTIKDEWGRPVGFAARDLSWSKGDKGPKFVNQKTTGAKCNIYQKGKRLYGLNRALKKKSEGPLYIVEGYADVISAHLSGFDRVVATCGTSLTDDHLYLLKEYNVYSIVLCYDGDAPGQERTEQLLDNKLANHKDMSVQILAIPEVGKDPDDYIREHGIEAFTELKPWSAFQWRLNRFNEEEDPEFIAKTMIPLVVGEPSHISQERMLLDLARYTGFTIKTLQGELSRLVNEKDRNRDRERGTIIDKLTSDVRKQPGDAEVLIAEAQAKLYSLRSKYDEDNFSEEATLRFVQDLKSSEEEKDEAYSGFVLGPDLAELQEALNGEWRKDVLLIFGGSANAGKSSILSKISIEIAKREEENNALVIYHTIDDSAEQLMPKFIAVCEGSTHLEINHIKHPRYWKTRPEIDYVDLKARREDGYNRFTKLIRDGRFVVKDATDGVSLGYAEALIKYYQDKYPDRQVVYVLDNFHKLRDFQGLDERVKWKTASQTIKYMAVKYHIPILCTMEYTKLPSGTKPSNSNIAESVAMEYDSNLICHLWNGLHELGDRADERHYHTVMKNGVPTRLPIVELNIGKNKISPFKSKLYFRFFPASSDFREQPLEAQMSLEEEMSASGNRSRQPQQALF